ncbi:amidohydrolase family protein [Geopsychrobacter electrodiphilus]|uniref:amidohydrolase family protein n=1 Tax=Geopsychrobacter electrodiphilus TaxID=225196 RepID=UPI000368F8D3|nr:amidohydrolase family protein [Geopsychrobacter electrodiphilus]
MENSGAQEIIDVHCHCFAGFEQSEQVEAGLARLRRAGLKHLAVMGLANTRLKRDEIIRLIPEGFENLGDPLFNEADALLSFSEKSEGLLFPMLDTRCLAGDVEEQLTASIARGFRGIKGLYLGDDRNDLHIASVPEIFGISLKQYQQREWEIFAFAEAHSLPVVYHMDARQYGDVMCAILDDFPRLRINFPHFGIGRKACSKILECYPNVFTDIAFMRPHIQQDPGSYIDFINHFPDRVCFGSDALLYQAKIVLEYIALVRSLQLPKELETAIFSSNPRAFLGLTAGKEN